MSKKSGDTGMRLRLTAARALNRMGKLLTPDAVSTAVADAGIAKSDAGAQLREMILGALDKAGGEDWLRRHGGEHLIPAYRRTRKAADSR